MNKEFNLSNYIINLSNLNNKDVSVIPVNRVKEFIRLLKEEKEKLIQNIKDYWNKPNIKINIIRGISQLGNKLAGDKLYGKT